MLRTTFTLHTRNPFVQLTVAVLAVISLLVIGIKPLNAKEPKEKVWT